MYISYQDDIKILADPASLMISNMDSSHYDRQIGIT